MFESSRSSGSRAPWILSILGAVAAAWWWGTSAPPSPPEAADASAPTSAAPVLAGTADEVRTHLAEVLQELPGGRLYHLDCTPMPCVATVRIPLPKGADANWRNRFEYALTARGWTLSPPGQVHLLDARTVGDGFLPERAFYTLAIRADAAPLDPEAKALAAERVSKQAKDGGIAFDPW